MRHLKPVTTSINYWRQVLEDATIGSTADIKSLWLNDKCSDTVGTSWGRQAGCSSRRRHDAKEAVCTYGQSEINFYQSEGLLQVSAFVKLHGAQKLNQKQGMYSVNKKASNNLSCS